MTHDDCKLNRALGIFFLVRCASRTFEYLSGKTSADPFLRKPINLAISIMFSCEDRLTVIDCSGVIVPIRGSDGCDGSKRLRISAAIVGHVSVSLATVPVGKVRTAVNAPANACLRGSAGAQLHAPRPGE